MKRFTILVFLTAVLATACCTRLHRQADGQAAVAELSAIDSLMWSQPDSAFAMLLSFAESHEVDSLDSYNEHYFHLLLSELIYKNDYTQTNRNELLQAVGYYDSLVDAGGARLNEGIVFLDARAHYINGVGFYERDSVVPACEQYMKALERMEERFSEKELTGKKAQFMAIAYTHLSDLFSDQYLHEQAILFGQISLSYYDKYDASPRHIAWMFETIGSHYDMMERFDSAFYYYDKAVKFLKDTNNLTYRDAATLRAFLSYRKDKDVKNALERLFQLLSLSESEKEYSSRSAIIGDIFYHEGNYDSAWVYLSHVFHKSPIQSSRKQAAEWLANICQIEGTDDRVYADYLLPFALQEEDNGTMKSQLIVLYDSFWQKQNDYLHRQLLTKHGVGSIIVVGFLLVVLVIALILYRKNKKQKQCLKVSIESERYAHKIQQAALAGRLRSKKSVELVSKETHKEDNFNYSFTKGNLVDYANEPICKHILEVCNDPNNVFKSSLSIREYSKLALTHQQKLQLNEAAIRHFGKLFEKVIKEHPEIKDKDLAYFQLRILGLNNTQIAVLLQKSTSTIWQRENRLQKIFGVEDSGSMILRLFNG